MPKLLVLKEKVVSSGCPQWTLRTYVLLLRRNHVLEYFACGLKLWME